MPELRIVEFSAEFTCLCGMDITIEVDIATTVRCNMCKRNYSVDINIDKLWVNFIKEK